jgi:hypothetical protein
MKLHASIINCLSVLENNITLCAMKKTLGSIFHPVFHFHLELNTIVDNERILLFVRTKFNGH